MDKPTVIDYSIQLDYDSPNQRIRLKVNFPKGGCYHATVSLGGLQLHNGDFDIIVLESTSSISHLKFLVCLLSLTYDNAV